jgi:hypothetical protein
MNLKSTYSLLAFAFLFIITTSTNLEARHHRHSSYVEVVNHTYYPPQYVVHQYQPQPIYVAQPRPVYVSQPAQVFVTQPVQTVVYQQPVIYQERTYVRERSSAAGLITSFALGLGFGLLR